jgi:hypothetical protein
VKYARRALALLLPLAFVTVGLPQQSASAPAGAAQSVSCTYSGIEVLRAEHCILVGNSGVPFVSAEVLKQLTFDANGLASIRVEGAGRFPWIYADRNGKIVVSGVPTFDNWADDFSDGLVRTAVAGKMGFADAKIVIAPAYDWATPFKEGHAEVCNGCREMCSQPGGAVEIGWARGGCDHTVMMGGEWFKIDKQGNVVEKLERH